MPLTATHRPDAPIVLHGSKLSGYSHRAELFLELPGLPCEFRQADLAGAQPSLADAAVYTDVAHAPECNVSLDDYPQVRV